MNDPLRACLVGICDDEHISRRPLNRSYDRCVLHDVQDSVCVQIFSVSFPFPGDRLSDDKSDAKARRGEVAECERLLRSAVISGMHAAKLAKSYRDVVTLGSSVLHTVSSAFTRASVPSRPKSTPTTARIHVVTS